MTNVCCRRNRGKHLLLASILHIGTFRTLHHVRNESGMRVKPDIILLASYHLSQTAFIG